MKPFLCPRLALPVLLGGLLLAFAPRVQAQFYSNRNAFNAAAPPLTIQTFENLVGTPQYPANNPPDNNLHYTNDPQGLTVSGVRMVGSGDFGSETYLTNASFANSFPFYTVDGSGSMILGRRLSDFYLPAGITAFGIDYCLDRYWLGPNPVGALLVTVQMTDGFTQTTTVPILGVSQFLGYTAPAGHGGISHIQLNSNGAGLYPYTLVDNMTYNVSAVPEPATWWTGAGLAFSVCGMVWRRTSRRRPGVLA